MPAPSTPAPAYKPLGRCDFCEKPALGFVEVKLPDHVNGGVRETVRYQVCAEHSNIGKPVARSDS